MEYIPWGVEEHSDDAAADGYTSAEQLSLAISLAVSVASMGWAFCNLDTDGRILRKFTVQTKGGEDDFPIVMGASSFKQKLCILPVRCSEVVARAGGLLAAAVSLKLADDSPWLLTVAMLMAPSLGQE